MGNSIRASLKKAGCTDHFLNKIFATNFEQLISAIEKNDLEKVKFYHLEKNVSFSNYLPTGDSPLHVAVACDHMDIAKYILENVKPLNIEDKNFKGDTIFMIATLKGNLKMIRYLVDVVQCNVNTRENRGSTPFFAACCNGYLEIIDYFLSELKIDYNVTNYDGQSVIHRVAYYGLLDVLKYLRKKTKLSFSSVDKKGNTPLHMASMRLNMTCLRYLLKHSSKREVLLNQKNLEQETPISIVVNILNKLKEPGIFEITKDEVIKYIKNKKDYPAITNVDVPSKLRGTLVGAPLEKTIALTKERMRMDNHLKPIHPFPERASYESSRSNISPKSLRINTNREKILSKVTPLETQKKPQKLVLPLGSKTNLGSKSNINPPELENNENNPNNVSQLPEKPEEKENLQEIKSALVRKRDRLRGRKSNKTPSPQKIEKEKNSPGKVGASPLHKFIAFFSPKKKKLPGLNVTKPQLTKGLTFEEAHNLVLQENNNFAQEDDEMNKSKEEKKNEGNNGYYEENKLIEKINEEEIQNRGPLMSLFSKHGKHFKKSPSNLLKQNMDFQEQEKEIDTPTNNVISHQNANSTVINIPEDSPFHVLVKFGNEEKNFSEREIKNKYNFRAF